MNKLKSFMTILAKMIGFIRLNIWKVGVIFIYNIVFQSFKGAIKPHWNIRYGCV